MAEVDGQEKTEEASGKRLDDSRNEGQVAKSMEINSLFIIVSGTALLYFTQGSIGNKVKEMTIYIFSSLNKLDINTNVLQDYTIKATLFFLSIIAPVLIGLAVISLAASYGQVGFRITPKALMPKFSKLNPANGIKNILFSSRTIVELIKSLVKLTIIALFSYWVLNDAVLGSINLIEYSIEEILSFMVKTSFGFVWKVSALFAFIAGSDFVYQKYHHKKTLMMTKQEVKDEMKQSEGDPFIKGKIKSKQLMMARSRMMKEIPKADVVITNPTHYAVALKYDIGKKNAPKVVGKGVDEVAQRIKRVAVENNIPLYEDRELAKALYRTCEIGDEIPSNLFKAVAQVLAYIYKLKNKIKKKSIV
jgi:flagellar biosynthetic protein FlhB